MDEVSRLKAILIQPTYGITPQKVIAARARHGKFMNLRSGLMELMREILNNIQYNLVKDRIPRHPDGTQDKAARKAMVYDVTDQAIKDFFSENFLTVNHQEFMSSHKVNALAEYDAMIRALLVQALESFDAHLGDNDRLRTMCHEVALAERTQSKSGTKMRRLSQPKRLALMEKSLLRVHEEKQEKIREAIAAKEAKAQQNRHLPESAIDTQAGRREETGVGNNGYIDVGRSTGQDPLVTQVRRSVDFSLVPHVVLCVNQSQQTWKVIKRCAVEEEAKTTQAERTHKASAKGLSTQIQFHYFSDADGKLGAVTDYTNNFSRMPESIRAALPKLFDEAAALQQIARQQVAELNQKLKGTASIAGNTAKEVM